MDPDETGVLNTIVYRASLSETERWVWQLSLCAVDQVPALLFERAPAPVAAVLGGGDELCHIAAFAYADHVRGRVRGWSAELKVRRLLGKPERVAEALDLFARLALLPYGLAFPPKDAPRPTRWRRPVCGRGYDMPRALRLVDRLDLAISGPEANLVQGVIGREVEFGTKNTWLHRMCGYFDDSDSS